MSEPFRAGIIGTGFMGGVHAHAVRASGGVVSRIASSSHDRASAAVGLLRAEHAAASAEELVRADDVDAVHICTPNASHARLAELALAAGKHVICEKPLATTVEDARRLVAAAGASGRITAVPFVYRYYATVREARARIASGAAGQLQLLHGSYLQDWLAGSEDTNWRVDAEVGGPSRAFADIGVHWCDLLEFTTGHRITSLTARLFRAFERRGVADGGTGAAVGTEDGAHVIFETDRGATGSVVVSQVSLGRKNRLWFSFDGEAEAYRFDQELPESLWIGGRSANRLQLRDRETLSSAARPYAVLPAGHPQGYQDCFNAFVADFYATVAGRPQDGLPTFADGLRAASITAAVLESAGSGRWVDVGRWHTPAGPQATRPATDETHLQGRS